MTVFHRYSGSDLKDYLIVTLSCFLFVSRQYGQDFLTSSLNAAAIVLVYQQLKASPDINFAIFWRTAGMYFLQFAYPIYTYYFPNSFLFAFLLLLTSILSAALLFFFPIAPACVLPGNFKVGTTSFNLQVEGHEYPLPVQCWFPVDSEKTSEEPAGLLWTSGHPAYSITELYQLLDRLAAYSGFPKFFSRHLLLCRANSIWQESFKHLVSSPAPLPVAVYSHGMHGWRQVHSSCCEKLASCGFIVFACDHAPDGMISRPVGEPDKSIVFNYFLPKGFNLQEERTFYGKGLQRRVEDLKCLMDHIQNPTKNSLLQSLHHRLDLQNINMFGHSFGGGTITSYNCQYHGVKRIVNLDSWMFPVPDEIQAQGILSASLLNLSAERWQFGKFQVPFRRKVITSSPTDYEVLDYVIRGSGHQSFCEMHLIASKHILMGLSLLPNTHDPHTFLEDLDRLIISYFLTDPVKRDRKDEESSNSYGNLSLKARLQPSAFHSHTNDKHVTYYERFWSFVEEHIVHERVVFHDVN